MNSVSTHGIRCDVQGEDKLPAEIGGEAAVCAAIADAAIPELQRVGVPPESVAVTVHVISTQTMSAVASVNERALRVQKVGVMDRPLNERAVKMLAQAVAGDLAKLRD